MEVGDKGIRESICCSLDAGAYDSFVLVKETLRNARGLRS